MAELLDRWVALLDEFDRQLTRSAEGLGLGTTSSGIWNMDDIRASIGPVGPVPESLAVRAHRVLVDYEEAFTRIQSTKRLVGEHLEMLRSVRGGADVHPVYLDRVS